MNSSDRLEAIAFDFKVSLDDLVNEIILMKKEQKSLQKRLSKLEEKKK